MKFGIGIFILFILNINVFAALTLDERRAQIVSIIDEELSEVSRLSKQSGDRNPNHLLRMAELYLEKARLWREKENQDFIGMPDDVRRKTDKKQFFAKSSSYFEMANRICLKIVKEHKSYQGISDVYYILGFNAKEANNTDLAQKYFANANKKSDRNSITKVKSQISLAEIYYNKKQYRKAIPLYERSLAEFKDKWWTKDSFNLAWCYFRENKFAIAISKMKEVFNASSDNKFIDMRSQVERDIGLFFATAGQIDEGIAFYQKIGINFTDQLLRIAVTMKSKGQFARADKTLMYALKYEKDEKRYGEIYVEQLDLFESFGKVNSHLTTSRKMHDLYKRKMLTDNQVKALIYQTGKMGATLQKQVASKTYARLQKQREAKAKGAIMYFNILKDLEPNKVHTYSFFQGETSYVIGDFENAIAYYDQGFDQSVAAKDATFMSRNIEGVLSSLGQRRLSKATQEKYYVPVYEKYLKYYEKDKRSSSIYQKLFKVYFDRNQFNEAKGVLDRFTASYPNDWKTQEAMIANLMEVSRKAKDNDKVRAWIADIDAGKYKVSKRYAQKLRELLTTMQIEDVQKDLKRGNKKEALVGYHKILQDPNSTKKSKVNAKYNLAALYYEMGATDNTFEWSNKALDEMSDKEANSFADSFLTMSSFLFTRLEFQKSANLSEKVVQKLCSENTRKKSIAFKNAAYIYLSEKDIKSVDRMMDLGVKCKIPTTYLDGIRFELLKDYKEAKAWNRYEQTIDILASNMKNRPRLIVPIYELETVHANMGNDSKVQSLRRTRLSYYQEAMKQKNDIPVEVLDLVAGQELYKLQSLQGQILKTELSFPFSVFQKQAGFIRQKLDQMIVESNKIQKIGSGFGIVEAYSYLIETHKQLADKFANFKPDKLTEQEKQNIETFYKQMQAQSSELNKTAMNLTKDVWSTIDQNQILSTSNSKVLPNDFGVNIRYWYPDSAIIMDRGGKQ